MTVLVSRAARLGAWAMLATCIGWVIYSWGTEGIVHVMLRADLPATDKLRVLRAFFESLGVLAPFAYIGVVTVEVVVAPIPGTILYAPAGVIFGGFWGGVLSLIGNLTGAALSFGLMRALGHEAFERFVARERLQELERRVVDRGALVVFLLRVNPLTSSDIVSYAAGATAMPLWKLLVGSLFGLAPQCFLQAYLAESLLAAYPWLIYPLFVIGIGYGLAFVWIVRRTVRGGRRRPPAARRPGGERTNA